MNGRKDYTGPASPPGATAVTRERALEIAVDQIRSGRGCSPSLIKLVLEDLALAAKVRAAQQECLDTKTAHSPCCPACNL